MKIGLKRGEYTGAVETVGGELVSFRDGQGVEYIWQGDPQFWQGRNPNLFPIVGALKDGTVCVNGEPFHMGRHGFARQSEFSLVEQGEDYVVLELRESPETLKQYPFAFILRVRHQLTDNGFYTQFEVQNPGETNLLFCIGAHTGINCPLKKGERFEDYCLVFDEVENLKPLIPTTQGLLSTGRFGPGMKDTDTIALDHKVFDQVDTLIFEGLRSKGVTLRHKDGGSEVHMDFGAFPMIAFWTMPNVNAPYICLEPWQGCAAWEDESGEFADKTHVIQLSPGEVKKLMYTLEVRQNRVIE